MLDLIALVEADFLPECTVCVDGCIQTEAVELAVTLDSITHDKLNMLSIMPENYQCVSISIITRCSEKL